MKIKKFVLISIGFLSLSLGLIGIVLPILPTTPFVLLSAACFSTSSPRLSRMIGRNKYIGSYIENYRNNTGVPKRIKVIAILYLWAGLITSMLLTLNAILCIILFILGFCVTIYLAHMKTKES